jgi:hypothetical protein
MKTRYAALVALLIAVAAMPAIAVGRDAFVGTWKVTVSPDDDAIKSGGKEIKGTLIFRGGMFKSVEFEKKGFKEAQYDEDTRGGVAATFKVKVKSETDGTTEWSGTSTGVDISGEMTWTKPDGTALKYTFKGEKQQ